MGSSIKRLQYRYDPQGNRTTYGYEPAGRRSVKKLANGTRASFTYNEVGNRTAVLEADG